ncbi:MAG: hypothetical protein M3P18_19150, partial [Actinomycetota bacterium]|nr:hypothetical protein [Actinomycetota bacterium]
PGASEAGVQPTLVSAAEHANLGTRVFELRPSAFRSWAGVKDADEKGYLDQMALFADRLTPGSKPLDIVWEIGLRDGYPLTARIERLKMVGTNAVWRMTDDASGRSFLACLDDLIKSKTVASLGLTSANTFVCRDSALTDELAANLALQCRLQTV